MRASRDYLDGLVQLHRQQDPEERRALWRQSIATLAALVGNHRRAVPLEGFHPEVLRSSVQSALESKLLDDLGWLSPPAAAAALYELAAALPSGSKERRELGRRVVKRLHEGDAATFVALATQLALGSRRALAGPGNRARVALSLDLPFGAGAQSDALALALISRRELEREWLAIPASGSLPARRLAARLLERAAREAARRASEGDDSGVRVFETSSVRAAWDRLLAERESLVWRHVASARGLLSNVLPAFAEEIERDLEPGLTPTEWRRAAASLAARIAVAPQRALDRSRQLLESEVLKRDRGIAGAMIFGLPRAAEAEPSAVEELLEQIIWTGGLDMAEALVELKRERVGEDFGSVAAELARARLREQLESDAEDDGQVALIEALDDELRPDAERETPSLRDLLGDAIAAFATGGAAQAYRHALAVMKAAEAKVDELESCREDHSEGRRRGFRALRDLDLALFETDALGALLVLGAQDDDAGKMTRPLGDLFERVTAWLIARERSPIGAGSMKHVTLRLRRLRAMLHLVDADGSYGDDRAHLLRERRLRTARVLLTRARDDAPSPLRRTVCAATARACDALVREEVVETSDVLVSLATHLASEQDLETIGEASMVPDIEASVRAYARLMNAVEEAPHSGAGVRAILDALKRLAHELPVASSPRVEALRASLLALDQALESTAACSSLMELAGGADGSPLVGLEGAVQALARLCQGGRRRLGEEIAEETPAAGASIRLVDFCLDKALQGTRDPLEDALASAAETLRLELPVVLAEVAVIVLSRIYTLPEEAPIELRTSFIPLVPKEAPLPPWLPPSRTIGGFFVVRALGAGAVGSVFVARRSDERHNPAAERFALKVPEYDGAAARTLSEAEFQQMFREEAGALLALPPNKNLARFVTFDAGAKPKPILVMELVEGPTLERLIESRALDVPRVLDILDGIAAGLETMHAVGVGHLDVKPSNVILRDPDGRAGPLPPSEPVLVDFGLAGRKVRPGCATAWYGAPEIWLPTPDGSRPAPADVYAFACLAFETLTGVELFDGASEVELITAHIQHDGQPPGLVPYLHDPSTGALATLLVRALRKSPAERATIAEIRAGLAQLRPELEPLAWPLSARP